MDAAPGLLGAPPPEVLEDVLREQFGPLPQLAAVCRLKRLPAGGYSSTEDLQLVLERRRVANAKERERVSPALVPTATWVHPGTGTDAAPLPRVPAARLGTPAGARRRRPGPAGAPRPVARPPPPADPPHWRRTRVRGGLRRALITSETSPWADAFPEHGGCASASHLTRPAGARGRRAHT